MALPVWALPVPGLSSWGCRVPVVHPGRQKQHQCAADVAAHGQNHSVGISWTDCDGGEAAWAQILHLDVKSSNVLLTRTLAAKIADVGVAKVMPCDEGIVLTQVLLLRHLPRLLPEGEAGTTLG